MHYIINHSMQVAAIDADSVVARQEHVEHIRIIFNQYEAQRVQAFNFPTQGFIKFFVQFH